MGDSETESYSKRIADFFYKYSGELKILAIILSYHIFYKDSFNLFKKNTDNEDPNIPESCPGISSFNAGKSKSCDGCPNQTKCSSGESKYVAESILLNVAENLQNVKEIILVMSGKGGVGKSTVATQVAYALENKGFSVGLLDIDITGPSIPGMTNTKGSEVYESIHGWTPIYITNKLSVMSIGYLMNDDNAPIVWRGPKKDSLIKQFLTGVHWEQLDYLIVDCPPGSSDEHITICNLLKDKSIKSILVTTPQLRAVDDVRRNAQFCVDVGIKIGLLVENMTDSVFDLNNKRVKSNPSQKLCMDYSIPKHVKIPTNSAITTAGETGLPLTDFNPFITIADVIINN